MAVLLLNVNGVKCNVKRNLLSVLRLTQYVQELYSSVTTQIVDDRPCHRSRSRQKITATCKLGDVCMHKLHTHRSHAVGMRFVQFLQGGKQYVGVEDGQGGTIYNLSATSGFPSDMRSFIEGGPGLLDKAKRYLCLKT